MSAGFSMTRIPGLVAALNHSNEIVTLYGESQMFYGLLLDLCNIQYVHVDPVTSTVRVGGGCQWSDVDHANHACGLAFRVNQNIKPAAI